MGGVGRVGGCGGGPGLGGIGPNVGRGLWPSWLASVLVLSKKLGPGLNTVKSSLLTFPQEKKQFQVETFNPCDPMVRY